VSGHEKTPDEHHPGSKFDLGHYTWATAVEFDMLEPLREALANRLNRRLRSAIPEQQNEQDL
jgi:hypothetical protein